MQILTWFEGNIDYEISNGEKSAQRRANQTKRTLFCSKF